jgi:hypothetical protein
MEYTDSLTVIDPESQLEESEKPPDCCVKLQLFQFEYHFQSIRGINRITRFFNRKFDSNLSHFFHQNLCTSYAGSPDLTYTGKVVQ